MFDVIKNLIDHTWDTSSYSSSEQQIIYYISGAIIVLIVCFTFNLISEIIASVRGRR